jgi:hypothetical protein
MSNSTFAQSFRAAFEQCEDPTLKKPVSLLFSRIRDRIENGYDPTRSFLETLEEIEPDMQKVNPEKFDLVVKAVSIGLGLEKSRAPLAPELAELRASSPQLAQ